MWSLCRWVSSSAVSALAPTPDGGGALQNAAAAVHEESLAARAHQCRRTRPLRVGDGAAGAEQGDLDHGSPGTVQLRCPGSENTDVRPRQFAIAWCETSSQMGAEAVMRISRRAAQQGRGGGDDQPRRRRSPSCSTVWSQHATSAPWSVVGRRTVWSASCRSGTSCAGCTRRGAELLGVPVSEIMTTLVVDLLAGRHRRQPQRADDREPGAARPGRSSTAGWRASSASATSSRPGWRNWSSEQRAAAGVHHPGLMTIGVSRSGTMRRCGRRCRQTCARCRACWAVLSIDDPVMMWMLPDDDARAQGLPRVFAAMTRHHFLASRRVEVASRDGDVGGGRAVGSAGAVEATPREELRMMPGFLLGDAVAGARRGRAGRRADEAQPPRGTALVSGASSAAIRTSVARVSGRR